MITQLGKFLRKLRIDKGEILKNMADKLQVSSSFLSAVENGKKRMPASWNSQICILYQLSPEERSAFNTAIAETEERLEMELHSLGQCQRETAVLFAREIPSLSADDIAKIQKILRKKEE